MNKKGHLLVTKLVSQKTGTKHRFWLLLGSITPDLLFHTYIKGHTWKASFERQSINIEKLWNEGHENRWFYFKLGYHLHYIEDYFTYPHNETFPGMALAHMVYEKDLTQALQNWQPCTSIPGMDMESASVDMLYMYLHVLHDDYLLQKKRGPETDRKYILGAACAFAQCMISAFSRNEQKIKRSNPLLQAPDILKGNILT